MAIKFANNASAALASGINSSVTTVTVTTGQGALFPVLVGSDYFYATLVDSSNNLEIVKVTARTGDSLTVVRAQEGTTARAFVAGDKLELRPTAAALTDVSTGVNLTALSGVAVTGGTINNTPIGGTTAAAGAFTTLSASGTVTLSGDVDMTGTGAVKVPTGTQAQRPGTGATGDFRFNTDISKFEGYNGSSWGSVGGGATGGGSDAVFMENDKTVTTNYTITANKNAVTTGPITINSGITVTVPSGSRWVVL